MGDSDKEKTTVSGLIKYISVITAKSSGYKDVSLYVSLKLGLWDKLKEKLGG